MILDAQRAVYVWIGRASHHAEQRLTYETAIEYTKATTVVADRPADTPVLRVLEGAEPFVFTVFFHGWDSGVNQTYKGGLESVYSVLQDYHRVYSYEDLVAKRYPRGLDESKLEAYLSDEEFFSVLHVTRAEWDKLLSWQKQKLKRDANLF
eukprot:TRINITY_DN1855_c0_g1_i3.p1 TRINITY_DN1855_c0_g1~~TRINITY_DN1855_c0_g1_i3.p1  ORF type:complete len:151 (-),score=42.93 TRINITY_DN1855_c0_g1_i3:188-640(-)